jgi:DNA-binding transcriptional LysR family regulator
MDQALVEAMSYVAVIAEEGSFARAAEKLKKSPSSVTRKIRGVERSYRAKFLERSTRQVQLTQLGRLVLPEIQIIVRHSDRVEELMRYYSQLINGPIRVG